MSGNRARGFSHCRRIVLILLVGLAGSLTLGDVAWAKAAKPKAPEVVEKSYVLPYSIVVLGIALGMVLVLRPVKRDDEPKRTDTVE